MCLFIGAPSSVQTDSLGLAKFMRDNVEGCCLLKQLSGYIHRAQRSGTAM